MGKSSKPTEAELAIPGVLWQREPGTVRRVQDALNATSLNANRKTGYTTVLKFLQIMTEEGPVSRDESPSAHVCQARHAAVWRSAGHG